MTYPFQTIEAKWQQRWDEAGVFRIPDVAIDDNGKAKPNLYILEMLPYPSGQIHVGHVRNYTLGDVLARFKRACGYNVLHPMGWDAFGLPAENAAIAQNVHPQSWTLSNIEDMRGELQSLGFSIDWSREVSTCDAAYYRFEQKMFCDFLAAGLVERTLSWVNWDPQEQTVLANEQVVDGKGWRSGVAVERRRLPQWSLKITDYAEELYEALDRSPLRERWPDKVRTMQRNWIGRSEGAYIRFAIVGQQGEALEVFTTRCDTIFGASFIAIAPTHPLVESILASRPDLQEAHQRLLADITDEATLAQAPKKGLDTGLSVQHPFLDDTVLPVYIANYVTVEYGTGVLFGCPAHDQRDLDFARAYDLKVIPVVCPPEQGELTITEEAYTGDGVMINSPGLNGHSVAEAQAQVMAWLTERNTGRKGVTWRLRDWGISRQRYWGCPIPIVYCPACGTVPVPEDQLPVALPLDVDMSVAGNPLDHHPTWKHTVCPRCQQPAVRETDTLDTFFESSWYFLRYCDPHNTSQAFDPAIVARWMPVDQYVGGIEHAVLHLLYARFFMRALSACGYFEVPIPEPFSGLFTQGMVCHATYQSGDGTWLTPEAVEQRGEDWVLRGSDEKVRVGRAVKMSKSKKNTVAPSEILAHYGADVARLYMMSDSPPERDLLWSAGGLEGTGRFLNRLWRLATAQSWPTGAASGKLTAEGEALMRATHKAIHTIEACYEGLRFNAAVAAARTLFNALEQVAPKPEHAQVRRYALETLLRVLNPITPHVTEELWERLGHSTLLITQPWPSHDPAWLVEDSVVVALQVNGKLRGTVSVERGLESSQLEEMALAHHNVVKNIGTVRKVIVIPDRLVNIVATPRA